MKIVIISLLMSYLLVGVTNRKIYLKGRLIRDSSLYTSVGGVESVYLENNIEHTLLDREK